jgi:hypothetical protein
MWQTFVVYYVVVFFCMCVTIPAKYTPVSAYNIALAMLWR